MANHCPHRESIRRFLDKKGPRAGVWLTSFPRQIRPRTAPRSNENCGGVNVTFQRAGHAGRPLSRTVEVHVHGRSSAVHGGRRMVADRVPSRGVCPKTGGVFLDRPQSPDQIGHAPRL